ncbi:MAG: hypothetical protein IPN94_11650 [Sphingobacteriales bacterium]|nr:hypothetical protein [Sphingobacteriales bacterium]
MLFGEKIGLPSKHIDTLYSRGFWHTQNPQANLGGLHAAFRAAEFACPLILLHKTLCPLI